MLYGYPDDYETRYNKIVICKDDFDGRGVETFEEAISKTLLLLFNAGYTCIVRQDEIGIIVIEYNYDDRLESKAGFGTPSPYWLSEEDEEDMYTVPRVWCATKEKDCIPHYFVDEKEANNYIGSELGYVEEIYFE